MPLSFQPPLSLIQDALHRTLTSSELGKLEASVPLFDVASKVLRKIIYQFELKAGNHLGGSL